MSATSRTALPVAMVVLIAWPALAWADETAEFRAGPLTLTISPQATARCRIEREGKPTLVGAATPFCSAVVGGRTLTSIRMRPTNRGLVFEFPGSPVVVRIVIEAKDDEYLQIEVADLRGDPDELRFVNVRAVGTTDVLAERFLVIDDMRLGLIVDSPTVRLRGLEGAGGRLMATAHRNLPGVDPDKAMIGRRAALFACRASELSDRIMTIEESYDIPIGLKGKINEANRRPYVLAYNVTHANIDRLIDYASRGGFGSILVQTDSWADTSQRYEVPAENFPGGVAQLKSAVGRIRKAGMLAGGHLIATVVPNHGAYVTPKPDRRLYVDARATLRRDVDASADHIEVLEVPADWPTDGGMQYLRIHDEIVAYTGVSVTPPYGFTGCKRGQCGTKATRHPAGTQVGHLRTGTSRRTFFIDHETDLLQELARDIARAYEAAGFDWVYINGAEAVPPPLWYTVANGELVLLRKLVPPPVIVQAAAESRFSWHLMTRTGQRDYGWVSDDLKLEVDYAVAHSVPRARRAMMTADIGWLPIRSGRWGMRRTTIDEVEYAFVKALGTNAVVSVFTSPGELDTHPHLEPILSIIRTLETLRLTHYFQPSVTVRVRQPKTDFMLVREEGGAYHLSRANQITDMYGGSESTVRIFLTEPVDAVQTVSLWPTNHPVQVRLPIPPKQVRITNYEHQKVAPLNTGKDWVMLPVRTRIYVRIPSRDDLPQILRQAQVSPLADR